MDLITKELDVDILLWFDRVEHCVYKHIWELNSQKGTIIASER